jgi:phage shock protein E
MRNVRVSIWLMAAVAAAVAPVFLARAELTDSQAREHANRGALVVDVRTVAEYKAKSLPGVTNIPLAEVSRRLPGLVTNESQAVLLHCRTGRRSGIAERELRAIGYTNTFNIGSFEKAERILSKPAE